MAAGRFPLDPRTDKEFIHSGVNLIHSGCNPAWGALSQATACRTKRLASPNPWRPVARVLEQ